MKQKFICLIIFVFNVQIFAEDYLNNSEYIAQRGFGKTEQIAQDNALSSLSKFFQMSISVSSSEKTTVVGDSSTNVLSEEMFVSSQTELFAVHYTKAKFDKKQKIYKTIAFINREEAWAIYKPELENNIKIFENFYKEAQNQTEAILKILKFSTALKNSKENELEKKLNFAVALYPESYNFYKTTRNHLSELEPQIKKYCSESSVYVECEKDFEELVESSIN